MAGSYKHCVDDNGNLLDNEHLVGMLENGGDVYEAVEEMYGMIWWLADVADNLQGSPGISQWVEEARQHYQEGLKVANDNH